MENRTLLIIGGLVLGLWLWRRKTASVNSKVGWLDPDSGLIIDLHPTYTDKDLDSNGAYPDEYVQNPIYDTYQLRDI